jgi:putative oxidoreductase
LAGSTIRLRRSRGRRLPDRQSPVIGFLIGITPIMHAFWKVDDPEMKQIQSAMFFKNVALLGAAPIIFYVYNQGQDLDLSITDALFGRI